jgi:hypothetical protein
MMNEVTIVQAGVHTLAGNFVEENGITVLKNPRMVIMRLVNDTQVSLSFGKLIGDPNEIQLENVDYHYELTEEKGVALYNKSCSMI